MSLSEKRKQEIANALTEGNEVIEYLREKGTLKKLNLGTSVFLGYVSSVNLIKHSKALNQWTKVIAFTSVALILFVIAQIVLIILIATGIISAS